jgi:hypothetical protein
VVSALIVFGAGKRPPFWVLLGMARVGVFMEFHDRDLPLPATFSVAADAPGVGPCFRDGEPTPELPASRLCHLGLFAAEGSHAHTDLLRWWSKARVTGIHLPAFLLDQGFVSRRLIAYVEEPCRAVRDFDTVVLPHQRAQAEAWAQGRPVTPMIARGWIGQEIEHLRLGFDCAGDGRPRPEFRDLWTATTFRLHLYDARGETMSTLELVPGWAGPRGVDAPASWPGRERLLQWLPRQFPRPGAPRPEGGS